MKDNKKLIAVIESIVTITLGILVAIFGIATVNIYFGIVFVVGAAAFLGITIYFLAKTHVMPFGPLAGFTILLTFGIMVLAGKVGLEYLIYLLVIALIGLGGALFIYGIYHVIKKNTVYGILLLIIGVFMLVAGILYLTVPEFNRAFWIIAGILIALYGVLMLVQAIADKKITK